MRVFQLPGGFRLLVGRDLEERERLQKIVLDAGRWSIALVVILGLAGGFLVTRRVLRRVRWIMPRTMPSPVCESITRAPRQNSEKMVEVTNTANTIAIHEYAADTSRHGRMPNMIQAGTYSATLSYLKAVKAAGTKDPDAVAKKLKELPVDDDFAQGGKVLENGRMVHDMYLFEVKKPSESKKPWDYYKQLAVVPGEKAFFTAKESGCPLTK